MSERKQHAPDFKAKVAFSYVKFELDQHLIDAIEDMVEEINTGLYATQLSQIGVEA